MGARDHIYPGIEETLSADRFGTYLGWADGDRDRAIALYTLDVVLSESLYPSLHMLEVALRNRIHSVMTGSCGESWFDMPQHQRNPLQPEMLRRARGDLGGKGKVEDRGGLVAALTFGYWTALLGKEYENLWQTTLHDIARREDGRGLRRKDFSKSLNAIRTLRNRLAHDEPVLHWDLSKHHAAILQMITWLSPVAADWCRACCRFETLYPRDRVLLTMTDSR